MARVTVTVDLESAQATDCHVSIASSVDPPSLAKRVRRRPICPASAADAHRPLRAHIVDATPVRIIRKQAGSA